MEFLASWEGLKLSIEQLTSDLAHSLTLKASPNESDTLSQKQQIRSTAIDIRRHYRDMELNLSE